MKLVVLTVLAAVQLGGGFGEASAEVDSLTENSMVIDIEVGVDSSSSAVVAHLTFDDDPQLTVPLLDRGGGVFGTRTEVEPKNYFVVFEAVGPPGELSQPVSLSDLGADLNSPLVVTTRPQAGEEEGFTQETRRVGWLALALAAASLSALAFWALGDRSEPDQDESPGPVEE